MIKVTKTFLPPLEEYPERLRNVWESGWITNEGPVVVELKEALRRYLVLLVSNGTLALQLAVRALNVQVQGEVITTPLSNVATGVGSGVLCLSLDHDLAGADIVRIVTIILSNLA